MTSAAVTPPTRLGLHHFAHLRAVAEGLSVAEAGQRYLGAERGAEASRLMETGRGVCLLLDTAIEHPLLPWPLRSPEFTACRHRVQRLLCSSEK